jgi:hypothetical protein
MEELAKPHVEAEGTRLRPLANNVTAHPAQDPFMYRYPGVVVERAVLDVIAKDTEPRFPGLMERLSQDPKARKVIDATGEHLDRGDGQAKNGNVWVISPHGDILDIAYVMKATIDRLHDQHYTPRRKIIVLSKALSMVGFELVPKQEPIETVGTTGMLCDDVFLTWARTKSAKAAVNRLPKSEVDRHNEQATEEMDQEFDQGGVLGAMAPTGTTRMARDRSGALILPVPNRGTLDLMMKPDTVILPVTAWFKSEDAIMAMPTEPLTITDDAAAHAMLKFMAEAMSEQIPEENFAYKAPRRRLGRSALGHHGE